jgi:uncharacterized protein YbaR (Trm112 family)
MHRGLIDLLVCPACHGELHWQIDREADGRVEEAEISCDACKSAYFVRQGIGMFLTPDLPRRDLWDEVESALLAHIKKDPVLQKHLMDSPIADLGPADLFFRAMVLEELGQYDEAKRLEKNANQGIYTPAYMACWEKQVEHVLARIPSSKDLIFDLASGRCYLVEEMARRLDRRIVATDFSPRVLRQDRARLEARGLYRNVSLLAFDARRTPLRSGAVQLLTSNLGLPNIEQPGDLLAELRRVVGGEFLAISLFYPADDEPNALALRQAKMETLLFRQSAVDAFRSAGWKVAMENRCWSKALPSPTSKLLDGAGIDAFPVAETTLEWCVLAAT